MGCAAGVSGPREPVAIMSVGWRHGDWPVRAEQADLGVLVGEGDSREESALGEVLVPVVGVVAPSVTYQDHLASNWGWVGGAEFSDRGIKDECAWSEELPDGAGDGKAFSLGLSCVLQA